MDVQAYLSFQGRTQEALDFYTSAIGAKIEVKAHPLSIQAGTQTVYAYEARPGRIVTSTNDTTAPNRSTPVEGISSVPLVTSLITPSTPAPEIAGMANRNENVAAASRRRPTASPACQWLLSGFPSRPIVTR